MEDAGLASQEAPGRGKEPGFANFNREVRQGGQGQAARGAMNESAEAGRAKNYKGLAPAETVRNDSPSRQDFLSRRYRFAIGALSSPRHSQAGEVSPSHWLLNPVPSSIPGCSTRWRHIRSTR